MLSRKIYIAVGFFIVIALFALFALAFKVSGFTHFSNEKYYEVKATFTNVGDLKERAPVTIAGVNVGTIETIKLDPVTFRADVVLLLKRSQNNIPVDSSASILTQGLLGSNYISITPGFSEKVLKQGDIITSTHSALILEHLLGQFMYSLNNDKKKD